MCGSAENAHVDARWAEVALMMQSEDGLFLVPTVGRPWDTSFENSSNPG
jgi:hypothetical protein